MNGRKVGSFEMLSGGKWDHFVYESESEAGRVQKRE